MCKRLVARIRNRPEVFGPPSRHLYPAGRPWEKARSSRMKETMIESPLIGSDSAEEAERRVQTLLDMGTSRGYLTYEELNTKLPDEVVSPDKLDSLLMMIDEMGIKLIDEHDVAEFTAKPRSGAKKPTKLTAITAGASPTSGGKLAAPSDDE